MKRPVVMLGLALCLIACEDRTATVTVQSASGSSLVRPFSDAAFDAEVIESDIPVLVDFWATWCTPCQMVAPTVDELALEYNGRVRVGKIDVDTNPKTAQRFGIDAIPALLIFHKGEVKQKLIGVTSKGDLAKALDSVLK